MSTQTQRGRKVQQKNTQKTLRIFFLVIAVVAVVGIGFLGFYLVNNTNNSVSSSGTEQIPEINAPVGITPEGFYYKGSPDAPVKVIEYSDFQCPGCAQYHTGLGETIETEYIETGKIQFIFHEFPLTSIHPYAIAAAEAARAAGEQGQFWQMHNLLFEKQREWATSMNPTSLFVGYAEQLGLDTDQFAEALRSNKYRNQVQAAEQAAEQAGVQATPTFVINGQQLRSDELIPAIEEALDASGQ